MVHPSHKVRYAYHQLIIKWKWYIFDCVQAIPESTSNLFEDVTQMPMILIPFTMPSSAKHELIVSWGVPLAQLTEEENTRTWFADGSPCYAGTTK